jgi:hypothetical protein
MASGDALGRWSGRTRKGQALEEITSIHCVPDGYRAMNDRKAIKAMVES